MEHTDTATLSNAIAVIGGLLLSVVGLGLLWAGMPVRYQLLLGLPFLALAFVLGVYGPRRTRAFLFVMAGATPMALLLVQFRDRDDSHLAFVAVVAAWAAGCLAGHLLARAWQRRDPA